MEKIVLLFLLSSAICQSGPSREARQFGWLWGNSNEKQADKRQEPKLRTSQVLQRRTNQYVNEIQGNGIGKFKKYPSHPALKRKYPPQSVPALNKIAVRRPAQPPPKRVQQRPEQKPVDKRKLLMPIIISSYASTNIQGRGNDDPEKIKEALEKYEKLNEISYDIKSDHIKEADITEIKDSYTDRVQAKVEELIVDENNNKDILVLGVEEKKEDIVDVTTIESVTSTEPALTTILDTTTHREIEEIESGAVIVTDSPFSNEIAEYDEGSPYLPDIPDKLDQEIHGAPEEKSELILAEENIPDNYLAGYQPVEPVETNLGNDHTEQEELNQDHADRPVNKPQGPQKPDFYPLGKPTIRPAFKNTKPQKLPTKNKENSFFDFLPFWKSSDQPKPKRPHKPPPPRRPVGPTVTKLEHKPHLDYPKGLQAPLLLKVGNPESSPPPHNIPSAGLINDNLKSKYPAQEIPERPETVEEPSENARIDNTIHTEIENTQQEAFVVLPAKEHKPPQQQPKQPHKPVQSLNYPARSNARPPKRPNSVPQAPRRPPPPKRYQQRPPHTRVNNNAPLPMLSQPVIGLPQVPASRKQSPFIAKRPPLPPQLPASYPGAPNSLPKKTYPLKPHLIRNQANKPIRPTNTPFTKKPNKKVFKKPEPFPAKVNENQQKFPAPSKVQETKLFDFKPNGSSKPASDIASHLSSLLNSFFSTTASPAPAPSLPSLVEDTEFADIVNGYKPSDENEKEIQKTALTKTQLRSPTTTRLPPLKSEQSLYDDLDSLSAPSLGSKYRPKKNHLFKSQPKPAVTTQLPTSLPITTLEPASPTTTLPTTTQTPSTTSTTRSTTSPPTTTSTSTTTTIYVPREEPTTAYISPIQELVNEYQKKGHVVPQNQYPEPVLKAIQKNFEHKKNIFEQFVSFEESDKAFIPNKEVYSSDWSRGNPINLSDKLLVYQTFPPSETTHPLAPSTVPPQTSTVHFELAKNSPTFPNERNAEGGFRPMLRPLHSPLLN